MQYFIFSIFLISFGRLEIFVEGYKNFAGNFGCGVGKERMGKIINGDKAYPGQTPWIASIKRDSPDFHICGGVVFHNRFVLTAGHCLYDQNELLKAHNFYVTLGELALDQRDNPKEKLFNVEEIYLNNYNQATKANDIALLKLNETVKFNPLAIMPVCLADETDEIEGKIATIAGWGQTFENFSVPSQDLRVADKLKILNDKECQDLMIEKKIGFKLEKGHLCALDKSDVGQDGCRGDSGGPLYIKHEKRAVLSGIVSAGRGCGRKDHPGLYTRISYYLNWIETVIKSYG